VRGTVVDAETGAPVDGVFILTLFDPEDAEDTEQLVWRRRSARMYEEANREGDRLAFGVVGAAHTDATGAFELTVGLGTSCSTGMSGITWSRSRGTAHGVARALLVEREGYARLVHLTKDARWQERQEGRIVGTLDVGTIRISR